jgi:hypothetical protein
MTGMLLISAHILDPLRNLRLLRKRDNGMDMHPEDETSNTTQYQQAFLKDVEDEYSSKHQRVPVNKRHTVPSSKLFPSTMASGSNQSSFDPYDPCSYDEEYLRRNNVPKPTPVRSDHSARVLNAARLYLDLLSEAPTN